MKPMKNKKRWIEMTSPYQDFEVPEQLAKETYEAIEKSRRKGKLRRGVNEVTKAIERKNTEIVIIAEDIEPPEIVAHLPILAKEKEVPYIFVPSQKELGSASGIKVGTSSLAINKAGEAEKEIRKIIEKVNQLKEPEEDEEETEEQETEQEDEKEETEEKKEDEEKQEKKEETEEETKDENEDDKEKDE